MERDDGVNVLAQIGQHLHENLRRDALTVASTIGATLWFSGSAAAFWVSVRLRSIRITAWPIILFVHLVLSSWWFYLNMNRWLNNKFDSEDYRSAIAPIVPVVLGLWGLTLAVWVVRARASDRNHVIVADTLEKAASIREEIMDASTLREDKFERSLAEAIESDES